MSVVVIGGGQAGLAAGHQLARAGLDFVILEAAAEPGAAWRARWDSLRLFTPARFSGLPGMPFPGDPDHYPTRDEVVEYLTDYARSLPVRLDSGVLAVRGEPGAYEVELADDTLAAEHVIVATGPFQVPRVPALPVAVPSGNPGSRGGPSCRSALHSADYRWPASLPGQRVLVVGGGNTGFQIAEELATAGREVQLAIGSRQAPLPQRVFGRDLFTYLDAIGAMRVTVDSPLGRRMRDRELLIGSSPRRARRLGITLRPRFDGSAVDADAVLWATGFTRDHSWVQAPGVHYLGLPWQTTRGSALLGWVGHDAAAVAARIAAAYSSRRALSARTTVATT